MDSEHNLVINLAGKNALLKQSLDEANARLDGFERKSRESKSTWENVLGIQPKKDDLDGWLHDSMGKLDQFAGRAGGFKQQVAGGLDLTGVGQKLRGRWPARCRGRPASVVRCSGASQRD